MVRRNSRALLVVALTVAALLVLLAGLAVKVGRPYPGFFVAPDFRVRFDPLRMHIGVNTGPALLGATKIEGRAGTRWTYTASGMTTNIVARLAAQAQGGEIVLSGETREHLGGDLELEDVGLRELKGVERPVPLYRLR
jgi:class 3 adenylate cyclase